MNLWHVLIKACVFRGVFAGKNSPFFCTRCRTSYCPSFCCRVTVPKNSLTELCLITHISKFIPPSTPSFVNLYHHNKRGTQSSKCVKTNVLGEIRKLQYLKVISGESKFLAHHGWLLDCITVRSRFFFVSRRLRYDRQSLDGSADSLREPADCSMSQSHFFCFLFFPLVIRSGDIHPRGDRGNFLTNQLF